MFILKLMHTDLIGLYFHSTSIMDWLEIKHLQTKYNLLIYLAEDTELSGS